MTDGPDHPIGHFISLYLATAPLPMLLLLLLLLILLGTRSNTPNRALLHTSPQIPSLFIAAIIPLATLLYSRSIYCTKVCVCVCVCFSPFLMSLRTVQFLTLTLTLLLHRCTLIWTAHMYYYIVDVQATRLPIQYQYSVVFATRT